MWYLLQIITPIMVGAFTTKARIRDELSTIWGESNDGSICFTKPSNKDKAKVMQSGFRFGMLYTIYTVFNEIMISMIYGLNGYSLLDSQHFGKAVIAFNCFVSIVITVYHMTSFGSTANKENKAYGDSPIPLILLSVAASILIGSLAFICVKCI